MVRIHPFLPMEEKKQIPVAHVRFTLKELEVLFYILDDWRTIKSDGQIPVSYPNFSTSSTQLVQLVDAIIRDMRAAENKRLLDKTEAE